MDENLPPIREPLDPGIKLAVELLRAKGLATVDSGDGYSKEEALEAGEALPYGHVYIQVDKPENVQEVIATASIIFWPYYGYQTPTVELLARPECHTATNEPDIVAVHWPVGGLRRADTGPYVSPFDAAGVQPTQKGGAPAELTPLEVRRMAVRDLLKSVGCRLGYSDSDAEVWWTQKGEVRRIPINGSRLSVSNQMDMLAAVERVLGIQPDVHAALPGKLPELGFPQIQVQTSGASLADLEAAAAGVTGTPPEAAADGSPDFLDEVVAASGPGFAEKVEAAQARRGANLCGGTGVEPTQRGGAPDVQARYDDLKMRRGVVTKRLEALGFQRTPCIKPDYFIAGVMLHPDGASVPMPNLVSLARAEELLRTAEDICERREALAGAEYRPQVKEDSSDAGRAPVQPPPGTQPSPVQMAIASVDLQSIKVWRDGWVDADIAFLSKGDIVLLPCPWKDTAFQVQSGAYVRRIGGAQRWVVDVVPVPIPEVAPLEPASKILDHATGPGTDGADDEKSIGDAATIADLQEKLASTIAAYNELHAMHERLLDLLSIMGIGHHPMTVYDRVITLLPRKRVTQWLSMQLAEARLQTERLRFDHPDADDSLDVIAAALAAEDEAHRRLRSYLGGPPPAKADET